MAADNEVNIKFGASIDDLKDKIGEATRVLSGFAASAGSFGQTASGAFAKVGESGKEMSVGLNEAFAAMPATVQAAGNAVLGYSSMLAGAAAGAKAIKDEPLIFPKLDGVEDVKEAPKLFDNLAASIRGVSTTALLWVAAAAGIGIAVKTLADANAEVVEGTRDFARALGISTNEATVLKASLEDVGASQGEFEGASKGLVRQLKTNEDGMNALGLVTRDQAGNLRPLNELTLDAIRVMGEYKEGTDRNTVSRELFGRGIDASSRLMLLNTQVVEENRQAVRELGLEVGENAVQGWEDYDKASDRASLTMHSFGKAIQESVLPVATELTEWFNNLAPEAITVLRGAIAGLSTAFLGLTNGVRVVWEVINAMVISVAEPIRALAAALGKAITGDFVGAAGEIKGIGGEITGAWETAFAKIGESSQKTKDRIGRMWAFTDGPDSEKGDSGSPAGTKTAPGKGEGADDKEAERLRKQQEAEAKRAAQEAARAAREEAAERARIAAAQSSLDKAGSDTALAQKKEALKDEGRALEDAYKGNLVTIRDYYAEKLEIERKSIQASIAAKETELAKAKSGAGDETLPKEQQLKFQERAVKLQGEITLLTMQEAEAVRANTNARADAEQKIADQLASIQSGRAQLRAADEIATERKLLADKLKIGEISSDEYFANEQRLEDRSYAALQSSLALKRSLIQGDNEAAQVQREKQATEEEAAFRSHEQRKLDISRAADAERVRYTTQAQGQINGAFSSMVASLLNGTTTMRNAFSAFANAVRTTFVNLISQRFTEQLFSATGANTAIKKMVDFFVDGIGEMISKFAFWKTTESTLTASTEVAKTTAVVAGATARTTAETGASAASTATTATTAIANIGAKAWEAAASVYASIAAIPFVGPFLAPAMAIAAGVAVLGFASRIASSEGGEYDVSQDRLNYVHKNETILPAPFAQGLRDLVGQGGLKPVQNIAETMENAWRAPANPLSRIQNPAMAATGSPTYTSTPARGGGGAAPTLGGVSAGNFYISTKKDLSKAFEYMRRNNVGGVR